MIGLTLLLPVGVVDIYFRNHRFAEKPNVFENGSFYHIQNRILKRSMLH
ncbi:hypothetical protein ACERJO_18725 [Halalkalibacter sp. AB-rgal2]